MHLRQVPAPETAASPGSADHTCRHPPYRHPEQAASSQLPDPWLLTLALRAAEQRVMDVGLRPLTLQTQASPPLLTQSPHLSVLLPALAPSSPSATRCLPISPSPEPLGPHPGWTRRPQTTPWPCMDPHLVRMMLMARRLTCDC